MLALCTCATPGYRHPRNNPRRLPPSERRAGVLPASGPDVQAGSVDDSVIQVLNMWLCWRCAKNAHES
jgi:hypothetical protein